MTVQPVAVTTPSAAVAGRPVRTRRIAAAVCTVAAAVVLAGGGVTVADRGAGGASGSAGAVLADDKGPTVPTP